MGSTALILHPSRRIQYVAENTLTDESNIRHPLLELRITSDKGFGLFAKHNISRGTRILAETPLFIVTPKGAADPLGLTRQLKTLTRLQQDAFYGLACNKELLDPKMRRLVRDAVTALPRFRIRGVAVDDFVQDEMKAHGTFKTNATRMGADEKLGIFPLYSRMNHSCIPNTHASYNQTLGTYTVHATRHIRAEEEVSTSYIDCAQPEENRTHDLEYFGVDCHCQACRIGTAHKTSEKKRTGMHELRRSLTVYDGDLSTSASRLPEYAIPRDPKHAAAAAEELIKLLHEEGLVAMQLASAYRKASKYSLQLGMVEKAKAYARKEAEVERYCLGTETEYMNAGPGGGNAESWMKHIEWPAEKDAVKFRMCEKRGKKEQKKADRKAEKKAKKG